MANVFIEESTLTAIGNAIRSKTGKTDLILPSEMPMEISRITGGSGNNDLVKYITFMSEDGATELFKMPVLSGDDCKDPVIHGDIDTPLKESTNTINYTYNGWSLISGGNADSSALRNVESDRIVYASYVESVRYYTVNFYTEAGVLHETIQVTYGGTATPTNSPTKYGYSFSGWTPSNENITSDTDCYAVWIESITFAGGSWEDIAKISEAGEAENYFSVGDERIININGTDVTFVIAGFNHDDLADGSGKAGISIVTKNVPPIAVSDFDVLYKDSSTPVDNVFLQYLPENLKTEIKIVAKECEASKNSGTDTVTANYMLFPISYHELGINITMSETYYNKLGTTYKLYEGTATRRKFYLAPDDKNEAKYVLLRGTQRIGQTTNDLCLNDGSVGTHENYTAITRYRIFGFCI